METINNVLGNSEVVQDLLCETLMTHTSQEEEEDASVSIGMIGVNDAAVVKGG